MPPADFESWLLHMGGGAKRISDKTASELLGIARNTVRAYRIGKYPVPLTVWLAAAALALGLPPWSRTVWWGAVSSRETLINRRRTPRAMPPALP